MSAMRGVSAISSVELVLGSRPASTVSRSWPNPSAVKPLPAKLPVRLSVRNESSMRPWTTGRAASPRYPALASMPGSRDISVSGRAAGIPGSTPGTLTNASLALIDVR
jgi:hypothetical protein